MAKRISAAGGKCYKWTGTVGCPDRLCIFPKGVIFVETKSEGKKLKPQQKLRHAEMRTVKAKIFVADTKNAVDTLIDQLFQEGIICI